MAFKGGPAAHRCVPLRIPLDYRAVTGGEVYRFTAAMNMHLEYSL